MSTALVRRLKKLEAVAVDPTGERQRRLAEGLCPDCGVAHSPLPTRGGPWRCVVCTRPFVLATGPACLQTCPVDGSRGCNCLQRGRIDHREKYPDVQARLDERYAENAWADLSASMAPEHLAVVQRWTDEHRAEDLVKRSDEAWYAMVSRLKPPALVRAAWLLIAHHVETNATVSLAPDVAEIYLAHPDAYPSRACAGCGTLLPSRGRPRADGGPELLGALPIGCPVCGLDGRVREASR